MVVDLDFENLDQRIQDMPDSCEWRVNVPSVIGVERGKDFAVEFIRQIRQSQFAE